jgi:heme exporter protein B
MWFMVAKDLLIELRTKEFLSASLVLGLLLVIVLNFGMQMSAADWIMSGPGILWICFLFTSVIAVGKVFENDFNTDALLGVDLLGLNRDFIFIAKALSVFILISVMELILIPVFIVLLGFNPISLFLLLPVVLFNIGFSLISTVFAVVARQTKSKDLMLPILLLPINLPILIAAVEMTHIISGEFVFTDLTNWLVVLVGFDLIYLVICPWIFGIILDE